MSNTNENTTYTNEREITSLVSKVTDTNDVTSVKSMSSNFISAVITKHL